MYPHHPASRRGGRTGHRATMRSPAPPSNAAAKAAAAAKALHRRAQGRAQEKQQQQQQMRQHQHQQLDDEQQMGSSENRLRRNNNDRPDPGNDVFRKIPHSNNNDGYGSRRSGEGGSILKRLTAGNNQRFHIGTSSSSPNGNVNQHDGGEENWREKSEELGPSSSPSAGASGPKYLQHHTSSSSSSSHGQQYPYPPPPGMNGAYPVPPGPYHLHSSQHHKYAHHHPVHSYHGSSASAVAVDDIRTNADRINRDPDAKAAAAVGVTRSQHEEEERHSQSNLNRPGSSSKSPHNPYPAPPRPHHYEGGYAAADPNLPQSYPYGAPPPPPPHSAHYPPGPSGHYPPPPPEAWRDHHHNENNDNTQNRRSRFPLPKNSSSTPLSTTEPLPIKSGKKSVTLHDSVENSAHYSSRQDPPPPSRSTRCIIGTHTPIHVPRAATREMDEDHHPYGNSQQPPPTNRDAGGIFRPSEKSTMGNHHGTNTTREREDENSAHKILLSLSKSFEHNVGEVKHLSRGEPRMGDGDGDGGIEKEERPKSPDEPPMIQHWHKQSSGSFEPQPSPLKLSYLKDADGSNIDLTSSFTLFNESFDMNFEGLLGPNASFGLGPMRSLSFGLGLGLAASVDQGDNPRPGSMAIQRQSSKLSSKPPKNDGGIEEKEDGTASPRPKRKFANVQVLRGSPISSGNNVTFREGSCSDAVGNGSTTVLIGGRRAGSPLGENPGPNEVGEPISSGSIDDSAQPSLNSSMSMNPRKRKDEGTGHDLNNNRENHAQQQRPHIERSLFGAMERHSSLFNMFSYLLPGAKTILMGDAFQNGGEGGNSVERRYIKPSKKDKELARRRVNSALCAFGGVVLPPPDSASWPESKKWLSAQKYEKSERYYEDENRLSWEIEEDPPIEISDSDDGDFEPITRGKSGDGEERSRSSLQRNIGVMVYPAVNAFTATEPGMITPALSDMNNFVELPESTPAKTTDSILPMVSPDVARLGIETSSNSCTRIDKRTPQRSVNYAGGAWISNHQSPRKVSPGNNPECPSTTDLLFVDMQELRPEQYRIVAQKKRKLSSPRYLYAALPLPYGQRKRISNAMFAMSKSIPGLTDECASVLGEARRRDAWDFAVAQLMTQVIVVTHCSVEDSRLDGLSKYLLTLGIAC
eukprot:CAMPEP_0196151774 /NCGR_PEP_ID=MMETSP0910-20130528/34267_1 /TAXON_ID=49265 /ORGANISM="Thalassiosira rotula, Strain GSO102" /LENGTH=1142 /DNA_ID=CAMNT_0041415209 /DNA_START=149 /DNA_END=3577 /DNA_ORIENTATION=-